MFSTAGLSTRMIYFTVFPISNRVRACISCSWKITTRRRKRSCVWLFINRLRSHQSANKQFSGNLSKISEMPINNLAAWSVQCMMKSPFALSVHDCDALMHRYASNFRFIFVAVSFQVDDLFGDTRRRMSVDSQCIHLVQCAMWCHMVPHQAHETHSLNWFLCSVTFNGCSRASCG